MTGDRMSMADAGGPVMPRVALIPLAGIGAVWLACSTILGLIAAAVMAVIESEEKS